MNKKIIGYIAITIVVILAIIIIFKPKDAAQNPGGNDVLLFTRFDCPHCKDLEAYITQKKIEEKTDTKKKYRDHGKSHVEYRNN